MNPAIQTQKTGNPNLTSPKLRIYSSLKTQSHIRSLPKTKQSQRRHNISSHSPYKSTSGTVPHLTSVAHNKTIPTSTLFTLTSVPTSKIHKNSFLQPRLSYNPYKTLTAECDRIMELCADEAKNKLKVFVCLIWMRGS